MQERRRREERKVLLVDAEEGTREGVAQGLRACGFRVVALGRREAAVSLFGVYQPDAVVVAARGQQELLCPAVRRLRALARGCVPLTFLVPLEEEALARRCLAEGLGLAVQPLPADPEALAACLQAQLRFRSALLSHGGRQGREKAALLEDRLTETASRPLLLSLVEQELRRCERYGGSFSVVGASVRDFAAFQNAHGEALAERLLVYASLVLRQAVRESDVVARVGRADFALLLPHTPAEEVGAVLARLEARLALARNEAHRVGQCLEVALGAISFPDVTGTAASLVGMAFRNMRRQSPRGLLAGGASLSA
jgi:diguanylate cyclase (GGDEF)-like protein